VYATIRLLASVIALIMGWTVVAVALIGLYWYGWSDLANIDLLSNAIPKPPDFVSLAFVSFIVPLSLLGLFLMLFMFLPARWVMELFIRKRRHERLVKDHPVVAETTAMCETLGIVTIPAVYVYDDPNPNAWAFATLTGSVVAISFGLTKTLTQHELRWVIAHELAHIKHFDAGSGGFWASTERVIEMAWRVHRFVVNLTVRGINATRMHMWIVAILIMPIIVVSYFAIVADCLSRKLFVLLDRVVGRAMEYRADEVAGRLVGPKYGVAVLEKLGAGIEPSFGLFATHPATPKRIERQQLLGLQLANQVDSRVGT
jgi:Zn-dependent protease with chaperone function